MSMLKTNNISTLSPNTTPLNVIATQILLNGQPIVPSVEIQDEGTTLTTTLRSINFIGTDVTVIENPPGSGNINVYVGLTPPPSFTITTFSVNPSILEFGTALSNPVFSYATLPTPADTLSIDNGIGSITVGAVYIHRDIPFSYILSRQHTFYLNSKFNRIPNSYGNNNRKLAK